MSDMEIYPTHTATQSAGQLNMGTCSTDPDSITSAGLPKDFDTTQDQNKVLDCPMNIRENQKQHIKCKMQHVKPGTAAVHYAFEKDN